jgi:hypothetical protein
MDKQKIEMKIRGLLIDPITRMPIIVLFCEEKPETVLPIWVGIFEANAIAIKMEDVESPRPMTHDLLNNLIDSLNYSVERIEIVDLKENTYFANIILRDTKGGEIRVDSRPSDAIALSLRSGSPIFVSETVIENANKISHTGDSDRMKDEDIKKWFESLSPDTMSKYKM